MNNTPATRLMRFVIEKLENEPLGFRALLYEDLSEFMPDETLARNLRHQANELRKVEQRMEVIKLTLRNCHS